MRQPLFHNDKIESVSDDKVRQHQEQVHKNILRQQKEEDAKGEMHIPYLRHFADNLNQEIKDANIKNGSPIKYAVGRQDKLQNIMSILMHKQKNTPMLIGEAGVGKTDIVEGLADALNRGKVPDMLKGYQVFTLDLGQLNNNINTNEKGYFNSNFSNIIRECERYNDRIILFIDEFHMLMGASKTSSSQGMDGSQLLKAPLARGLIKLIGATTYDEFFDYVEPDRAMQRRLSVIKVPEPDNPTTFKILRQNTAGYTKHYQGVQIKDNVLKRVVKLSARYMPDRFMPDKAFDILDDSMAEAMIRHQNQVDMEDVALAVKNKTNIPMSNIALALQPQVSHLGNKLRKRVKGQDKAIDTVVGSIDSFFAGLNDPTMPNASFLFLGTTGVGKTELAKAIAQALFGDENQMIRLDMASFDTKDATAKLVGSKNKRGILTEAVRRQPYGVLLLDEIEKAAPPVWDLLLSILDDGEIQDSRGRTVDFSNLIIIMTSNLATDAIKDRAAYMTTRNVTDEEKKQRERLFHKEVNSVLQRTFKPELVNRLNKVVFNILDKPQIISISQKYLDMLLHRLHRQGYDLMIDFDAIDYLTDLGTDVDNGARPLQRVLNKEIINRISQKIVRMKTSPKWDTKYKYLRTVSVTAKGKRPDKHDLWGNRNFIFHWSTKPLTDEQKKQRADIFTKANIHKMIKLHTDNYDNEAGLASSIRNKKSELHARRRNLTI